MSFTDALCESRAAAPLHECVGHVVCKATREQRSPVPSPSRAVRHSVRLRSSLWFGLLTLAALLGCTGTSSHDGSGGSPGRGIYVEAEWSRHRRVSGHFVHVEEQRIACKSCHELSATGMGSVSPSRCATCHEGRSTIQHAARLAQKRFGAGARADCVNCHAFTDEREGTAPPESKDAGAFEPFKPGECARCHQRSQGTVPAVVVHATTACLNCHRPHEEAKPVSSACASCHSGVATTHAALGKTADGTCRTCHAHQHAPASEALATCTDCHSKARPIVPASALFAGGHTACVSCHRPHEFAAKQAIPCRTCHTNVLVLAEAKVPAHANCASCHQPHDVKNSPAAACRSCHWDVHSDHPERAGPGGCVTCHDAHPARAQQPAVARACSSCHQQANSERAFHAGAACTSCHTPHRFQVAPAQHAACQACHQKELTLTATRAGHTACQTCHEGLPHHPKSGAAVCVTCHADAHREANAGHQKCVGCHEPHAGAVATSCSTCHARESASAPPGHQACTGCHQPHSGASKRVSCASCHANEATSAHGKLASGCLGCHRPHGPGGVAKPPPCTTCHTIATLPGLHAKPEHQSCLLCHGGHGDSPNAARSACLSCHADKRSHFPTAPRCANCHLFQTADHGLTAH